MRIASSPLREADRAVGAKRLRNGSTSEHLYWKFATECLFAIRPTQRGRFVYEEINPAFESRLGISSEELLEMDVSACLDEEDTKSIYKTLDVCLAKRAEVSRRHNLSLGGQRQAVETVISPVFDNRTGRIIRLIGRHRILDEQFLDEATEVVTQPRTNVRIASIHENVQRRIASELHDSTCQHLIAASLGVMRIRSSLHEPVTTERLCDDIDASIEDALRELRAFSYLLHPRDPMIDGLRATIENYAQGFAVRTSLQIRTRVVSDVDRLPCAKQRTMLRVVQEALTNVFRHANATEVELVFEVAGDHFRLTISDNGRGMPTGRSTANSPAMPPGVGIPSMRARLRQLGGTLEIGSSSDRQHRGTVLCAMFPRELATSRRGRRKAPGPNGAQGRILEARKRTTDRRCPSPT